MLLLLRVTYGDAIPEGEMETLARVFHARYIMKIAMMQSYPPYDILNAIELEINGAKALTPEQWEYITKRQYSLRFEEPLALPGDSKLV